MPADPRRETSYFSPHPGLWCASQLGNSEPLGKGNQWRDISRQKDVSPLSLTRLWLAGIGRGMLALWAGQAASQVVRCPPDDRRKPSFPADPAVLPSPWLVRPFIWFSQPALMLELLNISSQ